MRSAVPTPGEGQVLVRREAALSPGACPSPGADTDPKQAAEGSWGSWIGGPVCPATAGRSPSPRTEVVPKRLQVGVLVPLRVR
jgi:hypothetical protein